MSPPDVRCVGSGHQDKFLDAQFFLCIGVGGFMRSVSELGSANSTLHFRDILPSSSAASKQIQVC